MKLEWLLVLIAVLLVVCRTSNADEIHLKNGDRLSGEVLKIQSGAILLKTTYAGDVTITMDEVERLSISKPAYMQIKSGETITGPIVVKQRVVSIDTESGKSGAFLIDEVEAIRSAEIYQKEVARFLNPGWFELWSGTLESGLSLTAGNSETTNLTMGANAERTTRRDRTTLQAASVYATDNTGGLSRTTANAIRGGGRYEYNLGRRLTTFGFTNLEHDKFQNLDLRWVLGGGFGWYLRRNEVTELQLFGGGSYNREDFSDDTLRNSGSLLIGQELTHRWNERIKIRERFEFFPNLSDPGEYRASLDSSLVTTINKWFDWHVTFSERYLSNPAGSAGKNDLLLSTGIRLNLIQ